MPITDQMSFPSKEGVQQKWTSKVLFAFEKSISKVVDSLSPSQMILVFCILIAGVDELIRGRVSAGWYSILVVIVLWNFYLDLHPKKVCKK